jgi:hypothetical protein
MRFIVGQFRKFNKLIILGGFSRLPHWLELLEVMSMTKMHL